MSEESSREQEEHRKVQRADHDGVNPGELHATDNVPDNVPTHSPSLLGDSRLNGRGNQAMKIAVMRQMQQTYGNRAVQRFLRHAPGIAGADSVSEASATGSSGPAAIQRSATSAPVPIQRTDSIIHIEGEEGEEEQTVVQPMRAVQAMTIQRKPAVDALTTKEESALKPLITGSAADKQAAIDGVVKVLVKKAQLSLKKLEGNKVFYDAATVGEGLTTSSFKKSGTTSKLTIGDDAFASLSWLYSSIIHEYEHVKQHQALKDPSKWDEDVAEVQAYAKEIMKAKSTGVYSNKGQMEDLWKRLHDNYWVNITDKKKKKTLKPIVETAHEIAEKATGKTLKLTL